MKPKDTGTYFLLPGKYELPIKWKRLKGQGFISAKLEFKDGVLRRKSTRVSAVVGRRFPKKN